MLKIWGRNTSVNVQKVLWCCAELGIDFERVDLGGPFGGNQDPEYLALNPNGLVPTVQDGGLILWESNTICRYLAATRGGGRLYPSEPGPRALVERSLAPGESIVWSDRPRDRPLIRAIARALGLESRRLYAFTSEKRGFVVEGARAIVFALPPTVE